MGRLDVKNIDDVVLQEFKQFVLGKYGKLKGALSIKVTRALKFYLEHHKHKVLANVKKHLEMPRKKHLRLLYWLYSLDGDLITKDVIVGYIRNELGLTSRPTIRDYWEFVLPFLIEERVDKETGTIWYSIQKETIKEYLERQGIKVLPKTQIKPINEQTFKGNHEIR